MITKKELEDRLVSHERWLRGEEDGTLLVLNDCNLVGLDLSSRNLSFAELKNSNLAGVDLRGVNLSCANLSGSILAGSNLRYANLYGADLTNAKLNNAILKDTNTEKIIGYSVFSIQEDNQRISYWKELNLWTADSFQGTEEELIEFFKEHRKKIQVIDTIKFIKDMSNYTNIY